MSNMQSNKKFKLYSNWDFKSIVLTTIIIGLVGFVALTFYVPSCDSRERNTVYYNSETKGVIHSIVSKTGFTQGRTGNREVILGYEIRFYYIVDGKRLGNTDFIKGSSVADAKFVSYVRNNLNKEVFTVKYVSFKPEDSYIVKQLD